MFFRRRPQSSVLIVSKKPQDRQDAAEHLVRPHEVAHLFKMVPNALLPYGYTAIDSIAMWIRQMKATKQLNYRPDPRLSDFWQSPAVTLSDKGGDCEDLAILALAMSLRAEQSASLMLGNALLESGNLVGHAWLEGNDEQGWFLLEATTGEVHREQRPLMYFPLQKIPFFVPPPELSPFAKALLALQRKRSSTY